MFNFLGARLLDNACASVLTHHISTPMTPEGLSIILFTAFPPPPPTPITFIRHGDPDPSAAINGVAILILRKELLGRMQSIEKIMIPIFKTYYPLGPMEGK